MNKYPLDIIIPVYNEGKNIKTVLDKFEKHVDFESNFKDTSIAEANMKVIDNLVTRYKHTERL